MYLDLVNADTRITDHRARIAHAERIGLLQSMSSLSAASRRTSIMAVPVVGHLLHAVVKVFCAAGDLAQDSRESLRSNEQQLADLGIRWTTDVVYDTALAEELLGARQRRLIARDTAPPAPVCQARGYDIATSKPQRSNGGDFAKAGGRIRVSPRSAAVGGFGQAGD